MKDLIVPFFKFELATSVVDSVTEVLRSGWLTTGGMAQEFEQEICDYVGVDSAIALSSCTAALHIALIANGVGPGDEVITTPLTFCSTVSVIEHVGAKPVLADIDPNTGNISPELIDRAITKKTKAVIPVHYAGMPCDMSSIERICKDNSVLIIEDAAHAMGSKIEGVHVGSKNIGAFSFYATKNLSTGEGGMLTSNDPEFIDYCRKLSLHGMSRDAWKRYEAKGSWYYEVEYLGYKYNMPDILAAIGREQLKKLDQMNDARRTISDRYISAFKDSPRLMPIQFSVPSEVLHPRHLFPIALLLEGLTISRSSFIESLGEKGIGTSVHFIPIHYHPYFRNKYGWKNGDFPETENLYERLVSLPIYPSLSESDQDFVIESVLSLLENNKS